MTEEQSPLPRYLTHAQTADYLGLSRTEMRNKVLAGHLVEVDLSSTGTRRKPGISRESLEAYCDRLGEEARERAQWIQTYRRV